MDLEWNLDQLLGFYMKGEQIFKIVSFMYMC